MTPLLVYISAYPLQSLGFAAAAVTAGSLLAGFFAAMWRHFLPRISSLFVNLLFDVNSLEWPISEHVLRLLHKEGRLYPLGDNRFKSEYLNLRHEEKQRWVVFKALEVSSLLCLWRGRPIYIKSDTRHEASQRDSNAGTPSSGWHCFNIFYSLKRSINWKHLLSAAAAAADREQDAKDDPAAESAVRRYRVVRFGGSGRGSGPKKDDEQDPKRNDDFLRTASEVVNYGKEDLGIPPAVDPEADLSLTAEMSDLLREARFWYANREWYRDRGLSWRRGYLLYGPPGTGKCLGKGTPVLMFDGSVKPVELIVDGDLLMGPDSQPRTVRGTIKGREELYRVTPVKGEPYVVNKSHVLSLKHDRKLVNISVDKWLKRGSYFKARAKGWRSGVAFSPRPVPLDPHLLGLWLGDGTSSKAEITTADPEIFDYCRYQAQEMGLVLLGGYPTGAAKTWRFSTGDWGGRGKPRGTRNPMRAALRGLGVWENKHIPDIYKVNSREVRSAVLGGLIDTDGHLTCGGYEIIQKSKRLAEDILYLARSLGLAAYMTQKTSVCCNSPTKAEGTYWRIFISGDCSAIPVLLDRKRAQKRRQIKDVLVTGISIDPVGEGEYFGFELDGDGLFLLGDFTVTHNTSLLRAVAKKIDVEVHIFSLATLDSYEFNNSWETSCKTFARVVVFEDIDTVFEGRKNITKTDLTLDTLLNAIDGIEAAEGCLLFVTTNNVEVVDPALGAPQGDGGESTRPGRIDRTVYVGTLGYDGRYKIALRVTKDHEMAKEVASASEGCTGAQVQERAAKLAVSQIIGGRSE